MSRVRWVVLLVCSLGLIAGLAKLGFERAEYQRDWTERVQPWKVVIEPDAYFDARRDDGRLKRSDRLSAAQTHRDMLKILGWPLTLPSVERLYTSDVPHWSWWNRAENRRNQLLLQAQALLLRPDANSTLHLNAARDTAVVESRALVTLIHADISGLRETALVPVALADKLDHERPPANP